MGWDAQSSFVCPFILQWWQGRGEGGAFGIISSFPLSFPHLVFQPSHYKVLGGMSNPPPELARGTHSEDSPSDLGEQHPKAAVGDVLPCLEAEPLLGAL